MVDADRYRNPDEDLPLDFDTNRISITPLDLQQEPMNLAHLKREITGRWPMTSLKKSSALSLNSICSTKLKASLKKQRS
ncbi:hypothetical protein B5C26_14130 [Photorhabdus luminescens]|nr:hypothetical protein B5C26_14130 [Photorhabdus luminescens]